MAEKWTYEGANGTRFEHITDVNDSREYIRVSKMNGLKRIHIPLADFEMAVRKWREAE